MAYVEIPDADCDLDSYGREDTLFERLRDNIRAIRVLICSWLYAENTTTSTSYVTLESVDIAIPDVDGWTSQQRAFTHRFECKVSGGTGTFQLRDSASSDVGSEVTTTATGYESKEASIDVDAGWIGTTRTFELRAKVTATDTVYAQSVDNVASQLEF